MKDALLLDILGFQMIILMHLTDGDDPMGWLWLVICLIAFASSIIMSTIAIKKQEENDD